MMGEVSVIGSVFSFAAYALVAVFVENAVLGRALGVSRLVKLVSDNDGASSRMFCILLTIIQLLSGLMAFYANRLWLASESVSSHMRPIIFVLCIVIAFIVVLLVCAAFFPINVSKKIITTLPMATFNCCILGTLLITTIQGFTLAQMLGFSLGSSLSYISVVFVLTEGEKRLNKVHVPKSLQGLPINLLYLAILSMAVYGMTGHILSF